MDPESGGTHTVADVEKAIGDLEEEGWSRLRTAARDSLEGVDDAVRDHDDLLNEALTRLLSGARTWKRELGFEYQVARVMDSIASHWGERAASRPETPEHARSTPAGYEDEPGPLLDPASPERGTEDRMMAADEARAAAELFADDPEALAVLECMYLELSRREMQERTRMPQSRLEAALRRIRRRARAARSAPAAAAAPRPDPTPQVAPQVEKLLGVLEGELSRAEIMARLGLADRMHFARAYLQPALEAGWIERTIPDKPRSRNQRYRRIAEGAVQGLWPTPQVTPHVTPRVEKLLGVLEGELTRAEIMARLGLADRMHFARAYLRPALEAELVEMTIPGKPRSRNQRYRRTAGGGRRARDGRRSAKPYPGWRAAR